MKSLTRHIRFISRSTKHLVVCVACLLSSCTIVVREGEQKSVQPVQCRVTTVQTTASISHYTYMATVQAEAHIPLSLPLGGTVKRVNVKPHTQVSSGDVLLQVDETQARHALDAAQASFKQAQDAMRRATPMHNKGLITDIQMVDLQTKFDQAKAAVASAKQQLQQCTLTAPQSGLITYSDLYVGQHLPPQVTAMTLLDMSGFTVLIHVPEAEVSQLQPGDSATVSIPALHAENVPARLTQIGVEANSLTHTYPVQAVISLPPAGLLPGMVGTLSMQQREHCAIVIPQRCITLLPEGAAVWVVNSGNRAERRMVTTGAFTNNGVQILSGLTEGDKLVVAGYQKLYNNAQVNY